MLLSAWRGFNVSLFAYGKQSYCIAVKLQGCCSHRVLVIKYLLLVTLALIVLLRTTALTPVQCLFAVRRAAPVQQLPQHTHSLCLLRLTAAVSAHTPTPSHSLLLSLILTFILCLYQSLAITGQTGSGKSHSMVGDVAAPGLIPRFTDALFTVAQRAAAAGAGTYTVEVSLLTLHTTFVL
jgi:Kinesin motor domain